jgi:hypothetical protein
MSTSSSASVVKLLLVPRPWVVVAFNVLDAQNEPRHAQYLPGKRSATEPFVPLHRC